MPCRIFWTQQAREDVREIRAFIARDAPLTAIAFVRRLRISVGRLRQFPESGAVVPEVRDETIRELLFGPYRVIYRVGSDRVDVLTVYHSSRLFEEMP